MSPNEARSAEERGGLHGDGAWQTTTSSQHDYTSGFSVPVVFLILYAKGANKISLFNAYSAVIRRGGTSKHVS